MELQRGVCTLCLENNKVLPPIEAEDFTNLLPKIFNEPFSTDTEYQKIKSSIKICSLCCCKLQTADETRRTIKNAGVHKKSDSEAQKCYFCKKDKLIVKVKNDWKYFTDRTEGLLKSTDFPLCVCFHCIFYFDFLFMIRTNLIYKFPQLIKKIPKSPVTQNNVTPKRKSTTKSPPNSKKRKIFNNCFTYLQPLCNNSYFVDDKLKNDNRLYRKIAYVNLKGATLKETSKPRPVIKIKLKPKTKKVEKEKSSADAENKPKVEEVNKCKSEEIPKKTPVKLARRHSLVETKESQKESEPKLDETPKAADISNLVPKRRVSLYVEENESDNENKAEPIEVDAEEISTIVEKYVNDVSSVVDEEKTDLVEENKVENGIEPAVENQENKEEINKKEEEENEQAPPQQEDDEEKGKIVEDVQQEETPKTSEIENPESSPLNESIQETVSKNDGSSSDGGDSDESGKFKKDNPDRDSLNGSERKKKRVTFSDEIN